MIPKIIHYCWFGGGKHPDIVKKCLKSWQKFCPEYEIKLWNEDNYDVSKNTYLQQAYQARKWAFVSDYARLDIIYNYGGLYLDTDVELIKNLDPLLELDCFVAADNTGINTGLGFGADKNNQTIKAMLDLYENKQFLTPQGPDLTPCTTLNTKIFLEQGYIPNTKEIVNFCGAVILPPEYFNPIVGSTSELKITPKTYGIHWNSRLWETGLTKLKAEIRLKLGLTLISRIKKIFKR